MNVPREVAVASRAGGRMTAARGRIPGRGIALFVVGLSFGGMFAGPVEAQFSVQPVIMELRARDTAVVTTFAVRNEAAGEMQLRTYTGDFDQPGDGSHEFLEPGTHPRTCADRLEVFPADLTVQSMEQAQVRVRMEPGAATCWSMIFVESQVAGSGSVRIAQRIGVKVYGVGPESVPRGEVRSVTVDGGAGGRSVEVVFENTGESPVRPEGELEIRTAEGDIVAVVPVEPFSVLPGRTRQVTVPIDATLPAGRYLAIPILDFGADYLAGGQARFEVAR
ncbi:MAG: hypothetical protein ACOCUW_00655 [Gemmatimonadota bacterium]